MASVIEFDDNFKRNKTEFDFKQKNSKLMNEKSDTYDYLLKDKSKNLKKLSKLMEYKDEATKFINTPLHLVILNTITTVERVITAVSKNGVNVTLTYVDKFYLGVAIGFISILLLLFKI
jgi:hypothetical protein